ncbi:MAG: cysteine desulfurase [Chloroflexota bacterium]|nr:cysteine desulfurase [Chloroflexota bacterium]
MERPVYLDYNATTPVDPRVVKAMIPYLYEQFGNASSAHQYGYEANVAMERARGQMARLLGAKPAEVVFTGGGSETDNLAIKGVVFANLTKKPHVVTTSIEHPAVLNTVRYLEHRFGAECTIVPVDEFGLVDPDGIRAALRPNTVLVTVMHANNEVGTLQPIEEIGRITRERGILLHVDAAQSAGKIPIDVEALGVDLLAVAGHKIYGPKGMGALYIRRGTVIDPLVHGSGQEHGMHAGTQNVASMVGLGLAAELAAEDLPEEGPKLIALRDCLQTLLAERIPGLMLNGHPERRLPNTLNVSLPGALGPAVLAYAPGVAASTGSACHSGVNDPSPVLTAMGLPVDRALGALRLSLGRWSTNEDVERATDLLVQGYQAAGSLSPSFS